MGTIHTKTYALSNLALTTLAVTDTLLFQDHSLTFWGTSLKIKFSPYLPWKNFLPSHFYILPTVETFWVSRNPGELFPLPTENSEHLHRGYFFILFSAS
jgi:hypothetical protein